MITHETFYIGIEKMYAAELFSWWYEFGQPCKLMFMKAKTEGLIAIEVFINNDDAARFMLKIKERFNCKIVVKKKK